MAAGAATARATFELENAVQTLDAETDSLFRYDAAAQRATEQQRPWRDNPHYFKQYARCDAALCLAPCAARLPLLTRRRADAPHRCSVRISALALVKMTMHCRSGGNLEVRIGAVAAAARLLARQTLGVSRARAVASPPDAHAAR